MSILNFINKKVLEEKMKNTLAKDGRPKEIKNQQKEKESSLLKHLRSTSNSKILDSQFENISLEGSSGDTRWTNKGARSPEKTQSSSKNHKSNSDFDESFDRVKGLKSQSRRKRTRKRNKFNSKKNKFKNFKMKVSRRKSRKKKVRRSNKNTFSKSKLSLTSTRFSRKLRFPCVTTKKWIIYDMDKEAPIAGLNINKRGEVASLTKMMTCIIACEFIDKHNLDTYDTMYSLSYKAGKTRGTTGRLREGDYVPFEDLLHALMLPSGNDAGVTIAENVILHESLLTNPIPKHYNSKLYEKEIKKRMNRLLVRFYNKMNFKAKDLNMKNTNYASAHGLANRMNYSSPLDQAILATAALKNQRFRDVVSTVTYEADVERDGEFESIKYTNTNILLKKKNYFGVKTGITNPAGGCLVTGYKHQSGRYICVVVGSSGKKTRFSDTEALFEWYFMNKQAIDSAEAMDKFRMSRRRY